MYSYSTVLNTAIFFFSLTIYLQYPDNNYYRSHRIDKLPIMYALMSLQITAAIWTINYTCCTKKDALHYVCVHVSWEYSDHWKIFTYITAVKTLSTLYAFVSHEIPLYAENFITYVTRIRTFFTIHAFGRHQSTAIIEDLLHISQSYGWCPLCTSLCFFKLLSSL